MITRLQLLIAALIAIALLVAGVTWLFGPYGLIGAGVVLLVALLFIDIREE